ncbi:MAG TPA: hypothetical protein VNY31_02110 [Solirubrobacteraceae bacterium]|nr:hypothetical protein [Solirubrobacteraceae bacterium]
MAFLVLLVLDGPAGAAPNPNHPFAIEPGSFHIVPSTSQAGAHEDLTTTFNFDHAVNAEEKTFNDVKTTIVNLPPGFLGNSTAVPTCTDGQLSTGNKLGGCPPDSQVGTISVDLTLTARVPDRFTAPVYNMQSNTGVAATLGFNVGGVITQILPVSVRPGDTGITVTSPSIPDVSEPHAVSITIWGVPASPSHNAQRGEETSVSLESGAKTLIEHPGGEEVNIPQKPFLSNSTSCSGPFTATMSSDSWEEPEKWSEASTEIPAMTGCERLPFFPSLEVQPTTRSAESSSGLNVSLVVPQTYEDPESLASANLKANTVALPVGYTANPSLASGLGVCTPDQFEAETAEGLPGSGCPPESKIGSVEVQTPVLAEMLTGAVYIAKPYDNPFESLLALYIVVKDPERGLIVKLAGKIEPNPVTGQLVTTFGATPAFDGIPASGGNPQVPFSKFTLKLRQGANSPLISPPACGTYTAQATFTPWSEPLEEVPLSDSLQIEDGIGGGPCPAGGVPPFHPGLIAGAENNEAGAYSPMNIDISRQDGEQEITGFASQLPPGLTGNLTGIPFCSEADIAAARTKTGAEEEASASCPAASEIGHSVADAGVGSVLAQAPGKLYLAGPFEGAPFSVVSITSAHVGPFDLGTVVVHLPLHINPETADVTIPAGAADQIPHIIKGIIIHVREIRVSVNRPDFTFNPTSCAPLTFSATVIGGGADPTNPSGYDPVTTSDPFRVTACQALKFAPKFTVATSGKTSKADGASLHVDLTYPTGALGNDANIKYVKVDLPKQLPSRLTTLQKACTAAQFNTNPAGCPAASVIGTAKAITPILPVPLEGPAYFVSHGGEAFPDLEIVLQGYGVTIILTGNTFISKTGITSSTFKAVPDQPVTSFELTLPEGKYSALAANGDLCSLRNTVTVKKKVTVKVKGHKKTEIRKVKETQPASLQMPTEFVAQNGMTIHESTPVEVTNCTKTKSAQKSKHRAKHKRRKKAKK